MSEKTLVVPENMTLDYHTKEVLGGSRRFEKAAMSLTRMFVEPGVGEIVRGGKRMPDFKFFEQGSKYIVGMFEEKNAVVHFAKDAARGGPAAENAFVLTGQPGNGKTFLVDYICGHYRKFIAKPENQRYTFKFINLSVLGYPEQVTELHSLTFEDPMIMVMNIYNDRDQAKEYIAKKGFKDNQVDKFYRIYRHLGASTEYLWYKFMEHYDGDVEKVLKNVQVVPVPMRDSLGIMTGKYSAGDKLTSSSVDLLGEEAIQYMLWLQAGDPHVYNLQRGALARVGGGGIHFADEIFKNKTDLNYIYLQTVQNNTIEKHGYIWPMDVFIIATSNIDEYNKLANDKTEAPIKSRCRICYVGHNTDYKLQEQLTNYSLGSEERTTIFGKPMHKDPNLNYALSVAVTLSRLPELKNDKLSSIEMMKLEAGEIAGDKSIKILTEVKDEVNADRDVTKRWGHCGIGHRELGKCIQLLSSSSESNFSGCIFSQDAFKELERINLDYYDEEKTQNRNSEAIRVAKQLTRKKIKISIINAFKDDKEALKKDVLLYVNMIVHIDDDESSKGPNNQFSFRDASGQYRAIKIDEGFIKSVETELHLNSAEERNAFRNTIRKLYGQMKDKDPNYCFMDNESLVDAVVEVRMNSEVEGAASLVGALSNRQNESNQVLYNRMMKFMVNDLEYCKVCAEKTINYICEKDDES